MEFPPGCNWDTDSGDDKRNPQILGSERVAWSVFILPFIEQNNLHNQLQAATDKWTTEWEAALTPAGLPCASAVLPAYICPSDAGGDTNPTFTPIAVAGEVGKSNYVALAGAGNNDSGDAEEIDGDMDHFNASTDVNDGGTRNTSVLWGVFGKNSKTGIGQISDGTSNTIFLGERATRSNLDSGDAGAQDEEMGAVWCGVSNSNSDYPASPTTNQTVSKDWSVFGHMFSENAANWSINGRDTPRGPASSFHSGGANVALGDGSVRFMSQDLNVGILADLIRMADGNVVSGF